MRAEPQLPLAAEGELYYLTGPAAREQGRPSRALLKRALSVFARLDVPHSPRRSPVQRELDRRRAE